MRITSILRLIVACLLAACVTTQMQKAGEHGDNAFLTQAQLLSANSDNLYDAINKLRPEWFTTRGPSSITDPSLSSVSIFMNGALLGKAEYLRQVRILDVTEAKFWNAGQASARFGMGHPRGVIELRRK